MADKTKMIVRNDPAKKRISHCDNCGQETEFEPLDPAPVREDLIDFITKQEQWIEHPAPTIGWGLVEAVFIVVSEMAPSDEKAIQLITDVLEGFVESGNA